MAKTEKLPPKARSGAELRDRSWGLINRANLDYAPKFIGTTDPANKEYRAIDGLIRTPMGYYRLAEDMRDGTRILLHSYERDQLTGVDKGRGKIGLAPGATDVYGVTARKDVRGRIFRDDMNHDNRFLETSLQKNLNLHTDEIVTPSGRRTVRLANGAAAFGIYEMPNGRWQVKLFINLRKSWDKAALFAQADTNAKQGFFSNLFTMSRELKSFKSYEEAFQYVRKFWKTEATLTFRGQSSLTDPSTFPAKDRLKATILTAAMHFIDSKSYRDWKRSLLVGLVFGAGGFIFSGGMTTIAVAAGLVTTLGLTTVEKITESVFAALEAKKEKKTDDDELEALRPYLEKNDIARYLSKDENNERRFRKKIDPSVMQNLRLLNQNEADMNFDDGPLAPAANPLKDVERLSSAPYRYFGAQFDATHAEKGVLACIFPNGLLSVIQIDKDTRATRHYVTFSQRFNSLREGAPKKHLDPNLTTLPGKGPIHKITHYQGKHFGYVSLSEQEFMADLMAKVGPEAKDYRVFGLPLTDIFNVKGAEAIEPKSKDTTPVLQLIEQQQKQPEEDTRKPAEPAPVSRPA